MLRPTRFSLVLPVLMLGIVAIFAASACGGGGSSKATPTAPTSGPTLTDEQYLKAICTGTQDFSDALISKSTADGIAQVIRQFATSLKTLNPPGDLRTFHAAFIKYLEDSLTDPTSLLTKSPPEPPDGVRQRLASKEPSVPECKAPTFFDSQATPTAVATAAPTQ
ncbi:MAG: hypothetical protein ACRDG3_02080 [Tepidiformaceae bacterium]